MFRAAAYRLMLDTHVLGLSDLLNTVVERKTKILLAHGPVTAESRRVMRDIFRTRARRALRNIFNAREEGI